MPPKIESRADGTGKPFTSCLPAGKIMKKMPVEEFLLLQFACHNNEIWTPPRAFFHDLPTGLFDSLNKKVNFKPLYCKADMIYNKAYFKVHGKA